MFVCIKNRTLFLEEFLCFVFFYYCVSKVAFTNGKVQRMGKWNVWIGCLLCCGRVNWSGLSNALICAPQTSNNIL